LFRYERRFIQDRRRGRQNDESGCVVDRTASLIDTPLEIDIHPASAAP
jgi:hypothetical protein